MGRGETANSFGCNQYLGARTPLISPIEMRDSRHAGPRGPKRVAYIRLQPVPLTAPRRGPLRRFHSAIKWP
jgi:hypothetical protein